MAFAFGFQSCQQKHNEEKKDDMRKFTISILLFIIYIPSLLSQENKLNRPQTPVAPYPYQSENVTFENTTDGVTLAGTFTYPKGAGNLPAVVLISGSGPNDRDCDFLEHKPLLVIADFLTKNGIAVLRYDKRGIGQSTGDYATATSVDFARDVEFAVTYLKSRNEINKDKIGLIGHSEGGIIAPMVAEKSKDVRFIISMAGPTIKGDKLLLLQDRLISQSLGESESDIALADKINAQSYAIANDSISMENIKENLRAHIKNTYKDNPSLGKPETMSEDEFIDREIKFYTDNWTQFYIRYNPERALEKLNIPFLALFGGKDLQVPPMENAQILERLAKDKKNFQVTIIPNLNHLFQECETGSPREYKKIEQTVSPIALNKIANWINEK